jgi:hypothetical protein
MSDDMDPREDDGTLPGYDREPESSDPPRLSQGKRLVLAMSFSVMALILVLSLVTMSTVFSVTVATVSNVGGFVAEIEEVNGNDIQIYPEIGSTAVCPDTFSEPGEDRALAFARAEIGGAQVPPNSDLRFTKDISTPKIIGIQSFRVNATTNSGAGGLNLQNAIIDLTRLEASKIDLDSVTFNERYVGPNPTAGDRFGPSGEFIFEGQQLNNLSNARGVVHFVQFDTLNLPTIDVELEYNPSNPRTPQARLCQGLPGEQGVEAVTSYGNYDFDYRIAAVRFGDFPNRIESNTALRPDSPTSTAYTDLTERATVLERGRTYDSFDELRVWADSGASDICVRAWFDWDQTGFSSATDYHYFLGCNPGSDANPPHQPTDSFITGEDFNADITVPSDAEPGPTVMRITAYSQGAGITSTDYDATGFSYGEVQDYSVIVRQQPPDLEITNVQTNAPVGEGETLTYLVDVNNNGDTGFAQVRLGIDDDQTGDFIVEDSAGQQLGAGGSTQFTLEYPTVQGDEPAVDREINLFSNGIQQDSSTGTETVNDVLTPPNFEIRQLSDNAPIQETQTLQVTPTVNNSGETTDTQNVRLEVGGTQVDSTNVNLGEDQSATPTLTWTTSNGDAGFRNIQVLTDNDTASSTVLVEEPQPRFNISDLTVNDPVVQGETMTATVDVENDGLADGTAKLNMTVYLNGSFQNQVQVDQTTQSINQGNTQTVTLDWPTGTTGGTSDINDSHTLVVDVYRQNDGSLQERDARQNRVVTAPELILTNVNADNSVDVGSAGTNQNTLNTDITVENTAGPNVNKDISGDVYLDVDRLNNNNFVQRDSQFGVTVSENSQRTVTLSATIDQDDNADENENGNSMPVRGELDQGDPQVVPNTQTDTATLDAPYYEWEVTSLSATESGGSTAQAGLTNENGNNGAEPGIGTSFDEGVDIETVEATVQVTNTGDACGTIEYSYIDILGDTGSEGMGSGLCPGGTTTVTPQTDATNTTYPGPYQNPNDISVTPIESTATGSPYTEDTGTSASLDLTRPLSFSYSNLQSDGPIQDANNEMDVQFDVTNNAQVTDTTRWALDIETANSNFNNMDGDTPADFGAGDYNQFYTEVGAGSTITVGNSGDTGTRPWYDSQCEDHADSSTSNVDYFIDQEAENNVVPLNTGVLSDSTYADAEQGKDPPC